MKSSVKVVWAIVLLVAVLCLAQSFYTVQENEYACVVRFSKIIRTTEDPGLHMKAPFIDSLRVFPKATCSMTSIPRKF
jgi:membrane protease subunit HflC